MHYYPETHQAERGSIFDANRESENPSQMGNLPTNLQQKISQPADVMRKVQHIATFGDGDSAVFAQRFSPDDRYLATGYGDGLTRIYNLATGKLSYTLQQFDSDESSMPVTAVAWRPVTPQMKTQNVLVTA